MAPLGAALAVAAVDGGHPLVVAALDALDLVPRALLVGERERLAHGLAGETHDLRLDGRLLGALQVGRVLLADDGVRGEVGREERRDESLRRVVADCGCSRVSEELQKGREGAASARGSPRRP